MNILYSKKSTKTLNRLDSPTKKRIKKGIEDIPKGDIKPVEGYGDDRHRLRVGKYRIIYRIGVENNEQVLYIIDIGSRGDIYK